jgi:hypothetical protein
MYLAGSSTASKLTQALNILGIGENCLRDDKNRIIEIISPREHAKALFTYLNMAGYLDPDLLEKAVNYLATAKAFTVDNTTVIADLKRVHRVANSRDVFDAEYFLSNFAAEPYFSEIDIIELIVFLQQTAFDRKYGVERDRLRQQPFMASQEYKDTMTKLGVVTPRPPLLTHYSGSFVMGGASIRAIPRLQFLQSLGSDHSVYAGLIYALTGKRELSKGLDSDDVMREIAEAAGLPLNFVTRTLGTTNTEFLAGVTETMMVNYYINKLFPITQIGIVDSEVQAEHWRGTTAKNAVDIAPIIVERIKQNEITPARDGTYNFLVIAEQPFSQRMTMQIQREFNKLNSGYTIKLEGSGYGADLTNSNILATINSDMGALMAERYNDACLQLRRTANVVLRDPNMLMFTNRDKTFEAKTAELQAKATAEQSQTNVAWITP